MALTIVGNGVFGLGTTSVVAAYVAGNVGDLEFVGITNKPFSSTPTDDGSGFTQEATITSGSVANGNGTGSVRSTAFTKVLSTTSSGSNTFSVASGSPTLAQTYRVRADSGLMSTLGVGLADTDESLLTVSATGTVASGGIVAGDLLLIVVGVKDEAIGHASKALTVAGCTLGTVTWLAELDSTDGNDGSQWLGSVAVTAGSSTGALTYSATSSVAGGSATAVSIVRVRESAAIPKAPAPDSFDRRIRRNSLLRR